MATAPRERDVYERVSRQLDLAVRLLGFWIAVVSLFFLLQALDYRGLIAQLAEWQFLHFDRYWPTLTFVAMTTLFSAPLILAVWLMRLRQRRDETLGPARIDDGRIMRGRLGRLQGFFTGIGAGSLLAAIIVLVMSLQLPSDGPATPRSIVLGSPDAIAPVEGRTVLTGSVDLRETAQFNENLLLVKRTLYFAPIRAPGERGPLRYFVEVRRNDVRGYDAIKFPEREDLVRVWRFRLADRVFTPYTTGLLRRHALPGEIVNLYRWAGHEVDSDTYVLFSGIDKLRWRYHVLAGEFGLSALVSAIAALIFARRKRGVANRLREEGAAASAPA